MASNLSFNLNGPGRPLPTNPTVPGILNKFQGTPISTALNTATQPDWKSQLNTVMSGYKAPTNQPVSTGGQTMIPQTPKATGLVSKEIKTNVDGSKSEVHYDNKPQDSGMKTYPPGSAGNAGPALAGELHPATLPNGQAGFTNASGDFVDAQGNPIPAAGTVINQKPAGSAGVTFPGMIGAAQGYYGQLPGIGQQAANITTQAQKQYEDIGRQAARAGAGYSTTGTTPVAEGNAAVIARTAAAQQQAVTGGAQLGLTGLQQQQSALTGAGAGMAGLAGQVAPQQVGYNVQYVNPLTGQPYGVGETSQSLKDTVAGVVTKLNAGTMSYNDALNALSGYGQGGINELQKQLPPGFNIAQSNALAGQQGTVAVNYELADVALNNVENLQKELMAAQKTSIPMINQVANWVSTQFGIGSKETRAMAGAVQTLRNTYASLLASVRGGTPTDYSNQASVEIPAEPTPNDIAAIRANFETLGKARKEILGRPGAAGGTTGTGTFAETW